MAPADREKRRLTRGWCASGKSPTPAFTYRSLPRSRKKVSVRTVASAAIIPARLMAICPLEDKRFWSKPPSCFLSSWSWSLNLWKSPPSPLSLASPLMYCVGPSGAVGRGGYEFDEAIYLVGEHGHEDPHHQQQRHQYTQVGEPYGKGTLHEPMSVLEPVD